MMPERSTIAQQVVIRNAELRDVPIMKEILGSALQEYKTGVPDNYSVADIDEISSGQRNGIVFVVVKDEEVIGFAGLRPLDDNSIELKRFYITALQRNRGYGSHLLHFVMNHANTKGFDRIRLETTSLFAGAVQLYRKHGFCEISNDNLSSGHDLAFEKKLG